MKHVVMEMTLAAVLVLLANCTFVLSVSALSANRPHMVQQLPDKLPQVVIHVPVNLAFDGVANATIVCVPLAAFTSDTNAELLSFSRGKWSPCVGSQASTKPESEILDLLTMK